jgi:hypothetical protein
MLFERVVQRVSAGLLDVLFVLICSQVNPPFNVSSDADTAQAPYHTMCWSFSVDSMSCAIFQGLKEMYLFALHKEKHVVCQCCLCASPLP